MVVPCIINLTLKYNLKFEYMDTPELVINEQFGAHNKKTYRVQTCRASGTLATIAISVCTYSTKAQTTEAAYIETQQAPDELKTADNRTRRYFGK